MYSYVGGIQVRNNRLLTGVGGVSPLLPQTMGWQASVLAQNAPDTIVSTEGTLVIAKRFGDSNSVTVNGVTFAGHTLSNGIGTAEANNVFFVTPGSASAALKDLYDSVVYGTGVKHTINGLTVGTTYMLQWFFGDERTTYPDIPTRTQSVEIAGYTIAFPAPLTTKATKCYFVATATSHDITIGMPETVPHIMAFQVRQISGIGVSASLSASPASMSLGNSTTLAWSTGNAMAASISQGVLSFNGDDLYTVSPGNRLNYDLYLPRVSSSVSPTGIFAAVPAATPATFATANLYIASTTTINNFIQFASAGTTYSFNLTKSEVIYQNVDNVDNMILRWTGSISATGGTALPSTPAICIIEGGGNGSWRATLTAGPVGPFSIAALLVGGRAMSSSTTTVPVAGGSIAVAPSSTTTYSILAVAEDETSTTASATVTVTAAVAAVIGTQPSAQTIFSGTTSTLTVSATASAPLSYQWYQGTSGTTTTSVGINSASFTTPSLTSTTSYWVRVTNNGVSVDSATAVVTVVAAWAYTAWTNDADSGITSASTYTTAVNLGGSAVTVNNVQFAATATSGTGYSIGGNILTLSSGASAVTGNSATLANNFIYGGNPQRTVTLTNLTPGSMYETSLFSYGWEASGRVQTFASGSNTLTLDQDVYGNTNGIRIVYTFVADNTGTKVLTITPATASTFHLSALANRLLV